MYAGAAVNHDNTAGSETCQRVPESFGTGECVEVVASGGESWNGIGIQLGAQGDDQVIRVERGAGDGYAARFGIEPFDFAIPDLNTLALETREWLLDRFGPSFADHQPEQ